MKHIYLLYINFPSLPSVSSLSKDSVTCDRHRGKQELTLYNSALNERDIVVTITSQYSIYIYTHYSHSIMYYTTCYVTLSLTIHEV